MTARDDDRRDVARAAGPRDDFVVRLPHSLEEQRELLNTAAGPRDECCYGPNGHDPQDPHMFAAGPRYRPLPMCNCGCWDNYE